MSGQAGQSLSDPMAQSKIPLFEGTGASAGNVPAFLSHDAQQYNGTYYTYDPRENDRAGSVLWRRSSPCSVDQRSAVSHRSGMEGRNHPAHQPENKTVPAEESSSRSPSACHTTHKQGFTCYSRSPEVIGWAASSPTAIRKQAGSRTLSPPSENPVYLAIPKPVYGQSPCCSQLGCILGQRYSVEHMAQRMPSAVYDSEWMHAGPHYHPLSVAHRKASELLLQERGVQREPRGDRPPLKDMSAERYQTFGPSRARTFMESNYGSYPCTPPHTLVGPLAQQSLCLQAPPKGYHNLIPSHPCTYEHMPPTQHGILPQVYQEFSPMSKYDHLPQHHVFYYPHRHMEMEGKSTCKDIGKKQSENAVGFPKHKPSVSQECHNACSQPVHNHSFLLGFDPPCCPSHRAPLILPTVSPLGMHRDEPHVSPGNLRKGPCSASPGDGQSGASLLRMHVEGKLPVSPMNGALSPLTGFHKERFSASPVSWNTDRPSDYASHNAMSPKQPLEHADFSVASLSQSTSHHRDQINKVKNYGNNPFKITGFPVNVIREDIRVPPSGLCTTACKVLKRTSQTPTDHILAAIKTEKQDLLDSQDNFSKQQKIDSEIIGEEADHLTHSPPMPIIDNVFSLAPYRTYLQVPGMLPLPKRQKSTIQSTEAWATKQKLRIQEKGPKGNEEQPFSCVVPSGEMVKECSAAAVEKLAVEHVKIEKTEQEVDSCAENLKGRCEVIPADHSDITVKEEPRDMCSPDIQSLLVIKKCEPDEFEGKFLTELENQAPAESKESHLATDLQVGSSRQDVAQPPNTTVDVPSPRSPKPTISPQSPESTLNLRNNPPQSLKPFTYNLVLPYTLQAAAVLTPDTPPVQPTIDVESTPNLQKPVRQRFFQLHRSLCKQVSDLVSVSPEKELRSWISHLELTESTSRSTKTQKVSSLLGVRARDVWLSAEVRTALTTVLQRLGEYVTQEYCPFPHVMRAGAVFIPVLVLKELLFPQVQGSFINQVFQEHKVVLRPATLSEEKILTQLHKQVCSSALRRLLSLKHLPDVYTDVMNLFYHVCVCKHLGVALRRPVKSESEESAEERPEVAATPDGHERQEEAGADQCRPAPNGGDVEGEEEEEEEEELSGRRGARSPGGRDGRRAADKDPAKKREKPWTCPLTSEESSSSSSSSSSSFSSSSSSSPSDSEGEGASVPPRDGEKMRPPPRKPVSMVLKLRRVLLSKGLDGGNARYKAVPHPATPPEPEDGERGRETDGGRRRRRRRRQGEEGVAHSPLKIRYCPYLSACHSSKPRRRWVLRSARLYPDLVGKRILHLYEEDDKSEVWYRGEVVRVHEAHPDPLKTIFEVQYDSEPEWKYYLELLLDYKKGWLKVEG